MRIGRGHRNFRQVQLVKQLEKILNRSQVNEHYGNPNISTISEILSAQKELLTRGRTAQSLHRSTRDWQNFDKLLSANEGYTVAVKDNINTNRLPTTAASNILRTFQPHQNATVTRRLERAGLVLLSKTNMDEFGMGSHSLNSAFGRMSNGIDRDALSVGGSSGGSAVVVSEYMAHYGIGTDTGGSVRLPAAYMALVGFKPSYGRISRYGVIPYANSLDTVGIIARSAKDVHLMYDILDSPDPLDPTCLNDDTRRRIMEVKNQRRSKVQGSLITYVSPKTLRPLRNLGRWKGNPVLKSKGRRIGIPLEYNIAEMHPMVRWAWTATLSFLQSRGHEIVPISLPSTRHALSAYYILATAEASSNLAKYDGVRYGQKRTSPSAEDDNTLYAAHRYDYFGPEVRRRILLGTYSLSAGAMDNYFIKAQKIRRMVQNDFDSVFRMPNPLRNNSVGVENGVDLIVCPTAPTPPPHVKYLDSSNPTESYMNDVFTVPASLAGLPSISTPGPIHPDYPWKPELATSIQVIAQYGDDNEVIYVAKGLLSQFHQARPVTNSNKVKPM
ncbi:hypothetical protein PV10_07696 [Exophiala mesophila]|uniref:Glutamyl-tRNA(Gln) amidotransferase subunit A, mitochondrial n=1 Tax=Exophiala mesophila TaxID=212818 RepID=A0A0D1Z6B5_EXOME|nr:uncharacterized protein PV10_07696 [Exophiala mesophila]KIV90387.1 hypothetical protein PV10_07696 [Exophiala mesophila]